MAGAVPQARPGLRYELKLVCQESARASVLSMLRLHPAGLRELYAPRTVQSVYLDTPFARALEENRAGISTRQKLRFRWYGEETEQVQGALEQKFRENQLGWKELEVAEAPVRVAGSHRHEFVRALMRAASPSWARRLDRGLEPVQWISYRREYLRTADGRVRITLDHGLRSWDQRYRLRLSRLGAAPTPRILVLEVKAAPEDHELARQIVERLPIPVDRCSKFVLASDPGEGPHPSIFPI